MTLDEIKEKFKFIEKAKALEVGDRLVSPYSLGKIKRLIGKEVVNVKKANDEETSEGIESKKRFKYPLEKGKYVIVRVK
jgi:hypothetical protein